MNFIISSRLTVEVDWASERRWKYDHPKPDERTSFFLFVVERNQYTDARNERPSSLPNFIEVVASLFTFVTEFRFCQGKSNGEQIWSSSIPMYFFWVMKRKLNRSYSARFSIWLIIPKKQQFDDNKHKSMQIRII